MAHGFTDFVHNELLDWILRAEVPTLGATLYFAAYNDGVEVDAGDWDNYARVAVTRNTTNFDAPASGDSQNAIVVDFGTANIITPADVDEVRLYDASSGGNLVWQAPRTGGPVTVEDGDPVTIPVGGADFSFSQTA